MAGIVYSNHESVLQFRALLIIRTIKECIHMPMLCNSMNMYNMMLFLEYRPINGKYALKLLFAITM